MADVTLSSILSSGFPYKKEQKFLTSNTFTLPSTASPWVEVLLVGGGSGGRSNTSSGGGGGGGAVKKQMVHVTASVGVVIGAGGNGNSSTPGNGGASSFADMTANGGMYSVDCGVGGSPGGGSGGIYTAKSMGGDGTYGYGRGGHGVSWNNAAANTGDGGGYGGNGGSGICIVTYWDSVP